MHIQGDTHYVGEVYLNDVPIDCHFPNIGFHVPGGDEFHFLFNQRAAAQEGENTERVPLSYISCQCILTDGSRRKIMKNLPKNMSVMNPSQMTGSRRKKTGGAPTLKLNLTS